MGTLHGKIGDFSAYRCNFASERYANIIPTATSTFFTMTDLDIRMLTSSDVVDSRFKMTATEQEVGISFERLEIVLRF